MSAVAQEEFETVVRIEREQDMRLVDDFFDAEQGNRTEPQQHDRPENRAYGSRAAVLHYEQHEQNDNRDRNDPGLQLLRGDLETLDRRQVRNFQRDDAV